MTTKEYYTSNGVECTPEEVKLINSLKRLASAWKKDGKRLWLYSGGGTLYVMMHGDIESNTEPEMTSLGGVNPNNIIEYIDIPNDGGDW